MRVGGATSQLDLLSLTPLSVAGCGWLQLGVSRNFLGNIDAGLHCHCILFWHACICRFSSVVFRFEYCTENCEIISFVVIIRIIGNVIVVGYVLVAETNIIRLFQCSLDCYCDYCCLLIVLNQVRFRLRLRFPGRLMSLYGPTLIFMLPLPISVLYSNVSYIYPVSCLVEITLFQIISYSLLVSLT